MPATRKTPCTRSVAYSAALAAIDSQRPKDEIEAQLLIQMAAMHAYAKELLGRSKRSEYFDNMEATGIMKDDSRILQPVSALHFATRLPWCTLQVERGRTA